MQVLHSYTSPGRLEWLWNGLRMRHSMPRAMTSLLGSGTSPNESLHAEINRWYRNQPEVFPSTLALQLEVGRLGKLLSHNAALYHPTLRQFGQDLMLSASVSRVTIDTVAWQNWNESAVSLPHDRPLSVQRKALQERLREAGVPGRRMRSEVVHRVLKRPSACKRSSSSGIAQDRAAVPSVLVLKRPAARSHHDVKRTPFNMHRRHGAA